MLTLILLFLRPLPPVSRASFLGLACAQFARLESHQPLVQAHRPKPIRLYPALLPDRAFDRLMSKRTTLLHPFLPERVSCSCISLKYQGFLHVKLLLLARLSSGNNTSPIPFNSNLRLANHDAHAPLPSHQQPPPHEHGSERDHAPPNQLYTHCTLSHIPALNVVGLLTDWFNGYRTMIQ